MLKLNKNGRKVHQLLLTQSAALWGLCTSGDAFKYSAKYFHLSRDEKMFADANFEKRKR